MFKRFCISVLTAILLSFSSVGQVEQIKSIGDEAYVAGLLDTAVIHYESILDQEYVSAEVQYNLGNAYFRVGNIPQAILNYERALKLAPSDEDIQFNLRLAKLRTVDKIEAVPELWFVTRWNSFYQVLHVDNWAWVMVLMACFLIGCIMFFVAASNPFLKKFGFFGSIVFGVMFLLSVYLAQNAYNHLVNDNRAVVMQPTLTVKSSPDKSGNDLFVVHEGLVVQEEDQTGDWRRIKLPDGNTGWVPAGSLENI